jgi:hypothetical protein
MKKGWLIGCGIAGILGVLGLCVGLGILFFGGVFGFTQPVVDASNDFLSLLGQGKVAEAYTSTADGFRAQQDEASFTAGVKELGLTDYSSVVWHNRTRTNQEGAAEGTVTTKNGSTKPIAIRLVEEGGKWKVAGVRYGGVDLVTIKVSPPVPTDVQLEQLVMETLLSFNQAVQARDFTAFYDKVSDVWKKQTTPQQLQASFEEFLDKKIDIGPIKDVKPRFTKPAAVDSRGILLVAGDYPAQPFQVRFEVQYVFERAGWKLISLWVRAEKAGAVEKK